MRCKSACKNKLLVSCRPLHFLAKKDRITASLGFSAYQKRLKNRAGLYTFEYYKRENSEAGFSADKKLFGWGIAQRREYRIDSALFCTGLWHNLFNLNR